MSHLSYLVKTNGSYYYLVGMDFNDKCRIYIFEDTNLPFNNLSIKYLGHIDETDDLYRHFGIAEEANDEQE